MKGNCLCGEITFELSGDLASIYHCHCSLCRKVSGSSSNSALIIPKQQFTWTAGTDLIHSFVTNTGFRSDFCRNCGSPVPNEFSNGQSYWIPAGLLSEDIDSEVVAHFFVESRANWDTAFLSDPLPKFKAMPSETEWKALFHHAMEKKSSTRSSSKAD